MGVAKTNICISGSGGGASGNVDLPLNLKSFTAANGKNKVTLAWDFTNTNDLTGVQIAYKTGAYPTSPTDGNVVTVTGSTTKTKEITGLTNGTKYYFRAYPYREVSGVKYYQTYNANCKVTATPTEVTEGVIDKDGSKFYVLPKGSWADYGVGTSTETHPMFKVGDKELDYVAIGIYEASVESDKAVSKKGVAPKASVTWDQANTYCKNAGTGWHNITRLEWASIANWCAKHGITPTGNISGSSVQATGSGDATYTHNGKTDGITDLCGNVWEWNSGFRLVQGELQVISKTGVFDNSAADSSLDQSASSPYWYAIDGKTGALIKPNGSGTTANSLKASASGWTMGTASAYTKGSGGFYPYGCDSTICEKAKNILIALGLLKPSTLTTDPGDYLYLGKSTEYLGYAGGNYSKGANAGVFAFYCFVDRSYSSTNVGFRPAFVEL